LKEIFFCLYQGGLKDFWLMESEWRGHQFGFTAEGVGGAKTPAPPKEEK
jgi:hypothetical protein